MPSFPVLVTLYVSEKGPFANDIEQFWKKIEAPAHRAELPGKEDKYSCIASLYPAYKAGFREAGRS